MDKSLYATKKLAERMAENDPLRHSRVSRQAQAQGNFFEWNLNYRLCAKDGRRAQLLKNPAYAEVLNKYR